jgi:hypothetical protein
MHYLKSLLSALCLGLCISQLHAQTPVGSAPGLRKTENLLLVGWDGVRWQEIFTGVDSSLMNDPAYTHRSGGMRSLYWNDTVEVRRKKLFPWFWSTLQQNGQMYGNRTIGNKVDVSNPYNITGPGFTETLVGFADPAVNSNNKVLNNSTNVLEFINNQKEYKRKVAVFAMSNLFDYILNKGRSGLMISCDSDQVDRPDKEFQLLNEMQQLAPKPFGERPDLLTYFQAKEYLKLYRPRVMYLEMGETDDYGHAGSYDFYVSTLHSQEAMIAALWNYIQSIPQYKDKTTLLIACDHGRGGQIKSQWTGHGPQIKDSKDIFILAMGPDMPALGELNTNTQLYQGQMAATIAKFLGLDYKAEHPIMPVIETMFKK